MEEVSTQVVGDHITLAWLFFDQWGSPLVLQTAANVIDSKARNVSMNTKKLTFSRLLDVGLYLKPSLGEKSIKNKPFSYPLQ